MQENTRQYLINFYNKLPYRGNETCLKFCYTYNDVTVNAYFDAYDIDSVSFGIILNYKKYYYTPLNILNTCAASEYLSNINKEILLRILINNKLEDFFTTMEQHLLKDRPTILHYFKDKWFRETLKRSNPDNELPFWQGLRKTRMADETLLRLHAKTDISFKILKAIQEQGFTLVRTQDPKRRKSLTLILKDNKIILD